MILSSQTHSIFPKKDKKINFKKRRIQLLNLLSKKSLKEAHTKLISQDIASDLEIVENQVKSSLDSLRKELLTKNPNNNPINKSLEKQVNQLIKENNELKNKQLSKEMKEDLRIKAENLLLQANSEKKVDQKRKLLDEATQIIGFYIFEYIIVKNSFNLHC
jgi:hypothetical protein